MLVIGCGRLGGIFARKWHEREPSDAVVCTVRRPSSLARIADLDGRVLDLLDASAVREAVSGHRRVFVSVTGAEAWTTGMRNLAEALDPGTHVLHISSTGVYSEDRGGEVREDSELVPGSPLVAAERALADATATIFRCSGLVDRGQLPRRMLEAFAGTQRADGWLNLVCREDVGEAAVEAFARRVTGTFNVSATTILRSEYADPRLAALGLDAVEWSAGDSGKRVVGEAFAREFGTRLHPAP